LTLGVTLLRALFAAWSATRVYAFSAIQTRIAGTLIDILTRVSVASPANVARAVVMTRPKVAALSVKWVAVIFLDSTHCNLFLTELAFESCPSSRAIVYHLCTVALPLVDMLLAFASILARLACTLIDVDIAVAPSGGKLRALGGVR